MVVDDLSTGEPTRLAADTVLVRGSVLDGDRLRATIAEHRVTGVVHLAAKKQVASPSRSRCCTTTKTSRDCESSSRR